ncbi:hypothetical protein [Luteipulveratus halotolerans]|nr:hypothetical protein [Luteipulveratus halotolerans]
MSVHPSPDCDQGKHTACDQSAWDHTTDQPTNCDCTCHQEKR